MLTHIKNCIVPLATWICNLNFSLISLPNLVVFTLVRWLCPVHDSHQSGSAKAITCFLPGTWSLYIYNYIFKLWEQLYLLPSAFVSLQTRWCHYMTVETERVSHTSLPPWEHWPIFLSWAPSHSWLWHHLDSNSRSPSDLPLYHSGSFLNLFWVCKGNRVQITTTPKGYARVTLPRDHAPNLSGWVAKHEEETVRPGIKQTGNCFN